MAKVLYTAEANVTGGRDEGHGRTTDGALDVQLRTPTEMGGEAAAPTPSSCSRSDTRRASRARSEWPPAGSKAEVGDASINSQVSLLTEREPRLRPRGGARRHAAEVTDPELAVEFVAAAHQICPYSNATRGNIEVELTANGQPVS